MNKQQSTAFQFPCYEPEDCQNVRYFKDYKVQVGPKRYYVRAGLTFNLGHE